VFRARIAGRESEGAFVRTGDLGFRARGQLFVTGRCKDLIILKGRNLAPQDVERSVEGCDETLRSGCGAAFSVEVEGEERVVVVQEVSEAGRARAPRILERIRDAVAEEHGTRIHGALLTEARSIPKTSSGKVRRFACKRAFLEGSLPVVARL